MTHNSSPFKWRHSPGPPSSFSVSDGIAGINSLARDLAEMMRERGLIIDHTTVWRWVQQYGPEINQRMRPHLKMAGASFRIDETYIKVGREWKYLYRALDKEGNTVEFMLCGKTRYSRGETLL